MQRNNDTRNPCFYGRSIPEPDVNEEVAFIRWGLGVTRRVVPPIAAINDRLD
jgi:hypothetical protein